MGTDVLYEHTFPCQDLANQKGAEWSRKHAWRTLDRGSLPSPPAGSSSTPATRLLRNDSFGGRCYFESNGRVVAERPDVEPQMFAETGFTLAVLEPGKPTGMFHAESAQEDFLVLTGTCLLLIEEEERSLKAWDFVHCPTGTRHTFVGTGDGPCVIFMTGARREGKTLLYPRCGARARARRRGRDGDAEPARGVRTVRALAPGAAGRLARAALGRMRPWIACASTSGSGRRASRRRGAPRRTSSSPATSRSAASGSSRRERSRPATRSRSGSG